MMANPSSRGALQSSVGAQPCCSFGRHNTMTLRAGRHRPAAGRAQKRVVEVGLFADSSWGINTRLNHRELVVSSSAEALREN